MSVFSWFAGRRFQPGLWPTVGALVVIAATISLGNWQRHRAAEKAALQTQYEAMRTQPAEPLGRVLGLALEHPESLRYRTLRADGEYDAAHQIYLDNRVHQGRPGYEIITPFKLAGERFSVLVDRGWIAQGASRAELPAAAAPAGRREIRGRVNLPPARYLELASPAQHGPLWENLDLARVSTHFGLPLLPLVLELEDDSDGMLVRAWQPPNFGREQHLSYMVQWYSLAALTLVLYFT